MTTSESINELAAALAKAQGDIEGAVKDSANPFFKSKYADLASVWTACRLPLSANGLAVIQSPSVDALRVTVETLLIHTSGQWLRNTLSVTAKDDGPQALGSCITYLRRYALQSLVGIAPEDDDAEAAEGRSKTNGHANGHGNGQANAFKPTAPAGFPAWLDDLTSVADEGTGPLEKAWKASKIEYRQYLIATNPKTWETLKKTAATLTNEVPV